MGKKISLPVVGTEQVSTTAAATGSVEGDDVQQAIDQLVKSNKLVLFMKGVPQAPQCGFSARAVQILESLGQPYHAVDVLADPAIRHGIKVYGDWPTIPQVYLGGELLGGSDILLEMYQSGELAEAAQSAFGD